MKERGPDIAQHIVDNVMKKSIPERGRLNHPLAQKKGKHQVSVSSFNDKVKENLPEDVQAWTNKDFLDYFAKMYQECTGGNYRKVYKSDCKIFQSIGNFLHSNGLNRNQFTKEIIDWSFKRREDIMLRNSGHFTPNEILRSVNHFYQEATLNKVAATVGKTDAHLLEEIKEAELKGNAREIFMFYGIPVALTYLIKYRGYPEEKIVGATNQLLENLAKGGVLGKAQTSDIFKSSIMGSPYPDDFVMLEWRDKFSDYCSQFKREKWWRENDYPGEPLPKYLMFLNEKK